MNISPLLAATLEGIASGFGVFTSIIISLLSVGAQFYNFRTEKEKYDKAVAGGHGRRRGAEAWAWTTLGKVAWSGMVFGGILFLCCGGLGLLGRTHKDDLGNAGGNNGEGNGGAGLAGGNGAGANGRAGLGGGVPAVGQQGTLQLQFGNAPINFNELAILIDGAGVEQHLGVSNTNLDVPLAPGPHKVVVTLKGDEVASKEVVVKAPKEGKTSLDLSFIRPVEKEGTLQIKISPTDSNWWVNIEVFIDGADQKFFSSYGNYTEITKQLSAGDHKVVIKKNGIEVFSETVTVKRKTEGVTYLSAPLVTTGTVKILVLNALGRPDVIPPGMEAWIHVDDKDVKQIPVGAANVEVPVDVGTRVISVVIKQPKLPTKGPVKVDIAKGEVVTLEAGVTLTVKK